MRTIKNKLINFLKRPSLSEQAFYAYYHKLPNSISVSWERDKDDGYIVGKIKTDGEEFLTQGKDPNDFIDMVNDAVFTFYEVPFDYIDEIKKHKAFSPKKDELVRLFDGNIEEATFSMEKNKELQLA